LSRQGWPSKPLLVTLMAPNFCRRGRVLKPEQVTSMTERTQFSSVDLSIPRHKFIPTAILNWYDFGFQTYFLIDRTSRQQLQNEPAGNAKRGAEGSYTATWGSLPLRIAYNFINLVLLLAKLNECNPTLHRRLPPQTNSSAFAYSRSAKNAIDPRIVFGDNTRIYTKWSTARQPVAQPHYDNKAKKSEIIK
jgi:hypothetical protein